VKLTDRLVDHRPARRSRPPIPPRPGPRGRGSDASRRRLFEAAAREFATHGFEGASVDRIASSARLNKAMIYYHFGSKARLYGDILRDMFGAVGARVRAVAASPASPEEKVRRFVASIAEEANARPHFPPIWFREIADGGTHLDPQTIRDVAGVVSSLGGIIDAGVETGVFHRVDPFLVHAGIVGPLLLFFASTSLRERMSRAGLPVGQYQRGQVVDHIQHVTLAVLRGVAGGEMHVAAPTSEAKAGRGGRGHAALAGGRTKRRSS
jgi:AcrR family transcriptional regulator